MKLSEVKKALKDLNGLSFKLPTGKYVPAHFHVTEVGKLSKEFIDCGGTLRSEQRVSFQLWEANDYDHRLHPEKLVHIIELAQRELFLPDAEVEVEYQGDTIQKYALSFSEGVFLLQKQETDCLAKENCGIPVEKKKVQLSELQNQESCCAPGSSCC